MPSAVRSAWSAQRRKNADLRTLGAQWRCALVLSSIKSLGQNVPEELILAAVERGVLAPRQAAYFAEIKGPSASVALLARLAVATRDNQALSRELVLSALATACMARDHTSQVKRLSAAIEILFSVDLGFPPKQRSDRLGEALAAATTIDSDYVRSRVLAALAPHFPLEQRHSVFGEALAAAKAIHSDYARSRVLAALAPHLPLEQRHSVFGEALAAAEAIRNDDARSEALAALAPHLPLEQLGEALAAAKAIGDAHALSEALAALAPHLPLEQRHAVLGGKLAAVKAIRNDYARSKALADLVGCVPAAVQVDALLTLIDAAGNLSRPDALSAAAAGSRPTFEVGGQMAVLELHRAINDVCRWYP